MTGGALTAAAALREAARYGPFFAAQSVTDDIGPTGPDRAPMRPVLDLADPSTARRRVEAARTALRGRLPRPSSTGRDPLSDRVVGSTVLLGLAARLFSPWFGVAVATGLDLPLTPPDLWWQDAPGSAIPLYYGPAGPNREPKPAPVDALAAALGERVVIGLLQPLTDCYAETFRISRRVLTGNLSSAVAGAALALARARPADSRRAVALATAILDRGPLAGTARVGDPDRRGWGIRRRSCCLRYRMPGAGTCADCILTG